MGHLDSQNSLLFFQVPFDPHNFWHGHEHSTVIWSSSILIALLHFSCIDPLMGFKVLAMSWGPNRLPCLL